MVTTGDKPVMRFWVRFLDGTTGVVHCGKWVHGRPESLTELFCHQIKVSHAKELVNWVYLEERYGIRKKEMLRVAWARSSIHTESSQGTNKP